ncbi:MAG TPA: hypothetical protein VF395_07815 [Polyangiaceae bacterium]
MPRLSKRLTVCLASAIFVAPACVSDPSVEDDVPARSGAHQPAASGDDPVPAAAACERVLVAEKAARDSLDCKPRTPAPTCPIYLSIAGTRPCDSYEGSTVSVCEAEIAKYTTCSDFDTRPCVVTAVASTCHAPAVPEAGPRGDAGKAEGGLPDGSVPDATVDASAGADGDSSSEVSTADAGARDAAPDAP